MERPLELLQVWAAEVVALDGRADLLELGGKATFDVQPFEPEEAHPDRLPNGRGVASSAFTSG